MLPNIRQPNIRQHIRPNILADNAIGPTLKEVECLMELSLSELFYFPKHSSVLISDERAGAASAPSKNWLSLKNEEEPKSLMINLNFKQMVAKIP